MKIRVFDIPTYPGYVMTSDFKVIRLPYNDAKGRLRKEFEVSVNYNAEYAQLEMQRDGKRHTAKLHRLIALVFIPNPESLPQVNHKDGDKFNNSVENLEWCSASYNVKHSYEIGLASNKGERHPKAKFKSSDIADIIFMRKSGFLLRDIADLYDVSISTIGKITTGAHYAQGEGI